MKIADNIDAATQVFGVIGDPIGHTLSPLIHNTMAAMLGTNLVYTAFHVLPEDLESAIKGAHSLGIAGLNVTVPHKKAIMPYLSSLDATAELVGAVNTIKYTQEGYVGYNTDMIGAYYALELNGANLKDSRVLLLGAGGAANACAAMAGKYGAKELYIANRALSNAQKLAEHIKTNFDIKVSPITMHEVNTIEKCDLVINCTTLGFGDKAGLTPIEDRGFFKRAGVKTVFDAIYSPWETKLLEDAAAEGIKAINGFDMLIFQALAAREIWLNEKHDAAFRSELKELLTQYYLGEMK